MAESSSGVRRKQEDDYHQSLRTAEDEESDRGC